MLSSILSFLGLAQSDRYRREDHYLRAVALLNEVEANVQEAKTYIEWELYRLGPLCDSKSVSRDTTLAGLAEMLSQTEAVMVQVKQNRELLEDKGASKEVIIGLENWKSTSTQLHGYAQTVSAAIERTLSA